MEISRLNEELGKARQTVLSLRGDIEKKQVGTLSTPEKRAGVLVRKYGELYAQTRLDTMESLDCLPELNGLDDLKSKLLFSVIVVSISLFTVNSVT